MTALLLAAAALYVVIAYGSRHDARDRSADGTRRKPVGDFADHYERGFSSGCDRHHTRICCHDSIRDLIATQLYAVSSHDPLMYAIVLAVLSAAALSASYFAARRAMHLDPMVALRHE